MVRQIWEPPLSVNPNPIHLHTHTTHLTRSPSCDQSDCGASMLAVPVPSLPQIATLREIHVFLEYHNNELFVFVFAPDEGDLLPPTFSRYGVTSCSSSSATRTSPCAHHQQSNNNSNPFLTIKLFTFAPPSRLRSSPSLRLRAFCLHLRSAFAPLVLPSCF
jgi:hypothetical protein